MMELAILILVCVNLATTILLHRKRAEIFHAVKPGKAEPNEDALFEEYRDA